MSRRRFAILTTRLPPHVCGIGAYSWRLRENWPGASEPVHFFLMENGASAGPDFTTSFEGDGKRLSSALQNFGSGDLLVHYGARAYHRFGLPVWLPSVLAKWKRQFPQGRLVVFFHELAGEARFPSRHFWAGKVDRYIARRLVSLANAVATNTENHAENLRRFAHAKNVLVVPVGSNIEFEIAPVSRAKGEFVVFGLPFGRLQTLQRFDRHLRAWIQSGQLTRLHLVGPVDEKFSSESARLIATWPDPARANFHGLLASSEVARLLRRAQFALTNVTADTWSKSGAFMACAANECPIVVQGARAPSGPFASVIAADEVASITDDELAHRTSLLAEWFRQNADWPVIAQRIAALFPA